MAVLIILSVVILVSVALLLWCLAGFTRACQNTLQFTGILVRLGLMPQSSRGKSEAKGRLLSFPAKGSAPQSHEGTSGTQRHFLRKA